MFDDPKRDLQRLQQRLLQAEEPEEPEWEEEEDTDPEEALEQVKELLRREDWEETHREPLYRSYAPEEEAPEAAPLPPKKKKDPNKGIGGLLAAMVLETMALVALLLWWLLWK